MRKWKLTKTDVLFIALFIVILCIQAWKATIGMGSSDEHFYTTLGQRLYLGDALFTDDWHIAQLISVFIYPVVSIFESLTGSTTGMILYMRWIYILFTSIVGITIYVRFRKYGVYSVLGAVLYMVFTPFNIMALSYNTMSVGFLILACCLFPASIEDSSLLKNFFSGFFYALAVVNTPYLACLFIVFMIYTVVHKKKKGFSKRFLQSTIGIVVPAIAYILFILSRASLPDILDSLKYLIDPSHAANPIAMLFNNGYRLFGEMQYLGILILVVIVLDKHRKTRQELYFGLASLWVVFSILWVCVIHPVQMEIGGYAVLLCTLFGYGAILYALTEQKQKELFYGFYIIGFIHAVLIAASSNVGPRSFSGPLILSSIISILFLKQYITENPIQKTQLIGTLSIISILLTLGYFKISNIYGMSAFSCTEGISDGPLKGLKDTTAAVDNYNNYMKDIDTMNNLDSAHILFISNHSWLYLATDMPFDTNSTYLYLWDKASYEECISTYFLTHPEKEPVYIYLDQSNQYEITEEDPWMSQFAKRDILNCGTLFYKE